MLPDIPDGSIVAVDTEGSGLHPDDGARVSLISVAWRDPLTGTLESAHWPFDQGPNGDKDGRYTIFDKEIESQNLGEFEWVELMAWLGRMRHIWHNANYDLLMLAHGGRRNWENLAADFTWNLEWDTMIGQWLLDPLEKRSLKETAARLFGMDAKAEAEEMKEALSKRKKGPKRYDMVDVGVAGRYAEQDVRLTYLLYEVQQERLQGEDVHLLDQFNMEMQVARIIAQMCIKGLPFDVKGSRDATRKAKEALAIIAKALPFRPTPPEATKWFFHGEDGKPGRYMPHCLKPDGSPALQECCVRELVGFGSVEATRWQQYQKVLSLESRYYTGFREKAGRDGRIRTDLQQAGTINGRFASRRLNLQSLPHGYRFEAVDEFELPEPRSLIKPDPGTDMYELDLSQAELRVASKLARCTPMLEAIEAGDPHGETAKLLFHVEPGDHDFKRLRNVAKRCNFGLLYNIGPATFQADLEKQTGVKMSETETRALIQNWRSIYPHFKRINVKAEELVRQRGFIRLVDGRVRYWRVGEEWSKAFNAAVQGSIAQIVKWWMVEADKAHPGVMILQVHDSVVIQAPSGVAGERISEDIRRIGVEVATRVAKTPMDVDCKRWEY